METTTAKLRKPHQGKNISRLRELQGMKQDALAALLGVSQQTISKMEQSETLEDEKLEQVAKALNVNADAIKNFSEEGALNIIANTFNSHENSVSIGYQSTFNFNAIDKYVEAMEENKRLYEALLKEKDEKIALMERLLAKK